MLADGFYNNELITFSQTEKANKLNAYCKEEGLDYQHLLAEAHGRRLLFFIRKHPRDKAQIADIRQ
ncbi:MAG TPA: hypothetical protein VHT96_18080 [Clostridia bacterium]|nr:hypothetical protein [Clostridia bacterium]